MKKFSLTVFKNAEANREALLACLDQGLNREQIANQLGVAPNTANLYLSVLGFKPRRKARPKDEAKSLEMFELRKSGKTLAEIGAHFSVTREYVRQCLNKHYPDVIFPKHQAKTRPCRYCGTSFHSYVKNAEHCSRECWGLAKRKGVFTRDLAERLMKMRDQDKTWAKIEEETGIANLRSQVQRHLGIIFSTEEREKYFTEY